MREQPAYIEIVERYRGDEPDVLAPNEIRINGTPLLAPRANPIKVHEIEIGGDELVLVTLTLFAKRVEIKSEKVDE